MGPMHEGCQQLQRGRFVVPSVRIGVCVVVVGTDIKAFVSWYDLNSLTNFETILSFGNADLVVASLFLEKV